jgi:membrane protein insertase Oxa1/YidC/SpoIIIJ
MNLKDIKRYSSITANDSFFTQAVSYITPVLIGFFFFFNQSGIILRL